MAEGASPVPGCGRERCCCLLAVFQSVLAMAMIIVVVVPRLEGQSSASKWPDAVPKVRGGQGAQLHGLGFAVPPDLRPRGCRRGYSDVDLGPKSSVSIIIPYLRETWEHFSKTMRSVLHFTPDHLIKEFIFISDGNPPELTFEKELMAMSPKVRVLVNEVRTGLIQAKMKGVAAATGDVLVFLEAHCIVNREWLEPLLLRVFESPHALVQPVLDVIPVKDFDRYRRGPEGHWRFEWNMNLVFSSITSSEFTGRPEQPMPSPATSGGIFAIRRDWWNRLGFYDDQMLEWGGDHVEASMKVWRCGGHVELHPCSRVGHLFRDPVDRPYDVDVPTVVHNYGRLALVWFDDFLPHFQRMKPETKRMQLGDVSAQKALREKLGCKDMTWYTRYVDPEMEWEAPRICVPGFAVKWGGCGEGTQAAPGRSTVNQTMPPAEYERRRAEIRAHWAAQPPDVENFDDHEL